MRETPLAVPFAAGLALAVTLRLLVAPLWWGWGAKQEEEKEDLEADSASVYDAPYIGLGDI